MAKPNTGAACQSKEAVSIERAIRSFGRRLEADGRSPKTVSAYLRDLSRMAGAITSQHPGITLNNVAGTMIDEALTSPEVMTSARGGARSRASMHRFRAAIRSFFSWAELSGLLLKNPAACLALHRLPRTPPRFLTETEKRRLLKELRGWSSTVAIRDRIIIELFLGTGIRLQELVDLDIDDVELDAEHLRVHAKGGVPQVKFLKSNLCSLLRSYLKQRQSWSDGERRALFLSNRGKRLCERQVARRLQHWLEAADIRKSVSPHVLRHTFATHLYSRTRNILVVQRALGHRDLSTTLVYTHLVDGELQDALETL
jgi:integrase/recombinase XerC